MELKDIVWKSFLLVGLLSVFAPGIEKTISFTKQSYMMLKLKSRITKLKSFSVLNERSFAVYFPKGRYSKLTVYELANDSTCEPASLKKSQEVYNFGQEESSKYILESHQDLIYCFYSSKEPMVFGESVATIKFHSDESTFFFENKPEPFEFKIEVPSFKIATI